MYNEDLLYAQDYGLCSELSRYGRIVTLDDVLLHYRTHKDQISVGRRDTQIRYDKKVKKKLLSELLEDVTEQEVDQHFYYSVGLSQDAKINPEIASWYDRLLEANNSLGLYDRKKMQRHVERVKRRLVAHLLTEEMTMREKLSLILRYVSLSSAFKMIVEKRAGCYD